VTISHNGLWHTKCQLLTYPIGVYLPPHATNVTHATKYWAPSMLYRTCETIAA